MLFFIALSTTLVVLRLHTYYQTLSSTYEDIRGLITAHAEEITQGIDRYGPAYAEYLVKAMIEDTRDKRLYLLFRQGKHVSGNLTEWPADIMPQAHWQEVSVPQEDDKPPLNILVKIISFKNSSSLLLIGYDLQRVEFLRDTLLHVALRHVALSLLMSFILSVTVVWLVNRHLHLINRACERVMHGQMQYRIKVRGANDQFDQLGANVNRMLDWIEALLGTVRDSTNALAHDMRTPLSRHRLELQALIDDPDLSETTRQKVRGAVGRVDDIVEMFDNILSIAKAESRSGTELFTAINVAETVEDVVEFYAALMEEKSLSLATDIPAEPVWVTGDKQLISQAIVNLLDNAAKYTPAGGQVKVSLNTAGEFVTIVVADNGPGIPSHLLSKAKERFFRIDESRNTPGSGLGLSLANAVAELHHGKLVLEQNEPGLRAVLTFSRNHEKA